mmetsp:Transcript_32814/g.37215  ORF Transcript_32814/g.37215 Transcript_32814/m.37215 type:complete len:83 (+) Transcript_32814:172-420(+)
MVHLFIGERVFVTPPRFLSPSSSGGWSQYMENNRTSRIFVFVFAPSDSFFETQSMKQDKILRRSKTQRRRRNTHKFLIQRQK